MRVFGWICAKIPGITIFFSTCVCARAILLKVLGNSQDADIHVKWQNTKVLSQNWVLSF